MGVGWVGTSIGVGCLLCCDARACVSIAAGRAIGLIDRSIALPSLMAACAFLSVWLVVVAAAAAAAAWRNRKESGLARSAGRLDSRDGHQTP